MIIRTVLGVLDRDLNVPNQGLLGIFYSKRVKFDFYHVEIPFFPPASVHVCPVKMVVIRVILVFLPAAVV